jgi:hypothetical protein
MQSSGQIKLSEIAAEYGGSVPHALSEYHDKGNAPASGEIQIAADFYGTSAYTPTAQSYTSSSTYTIHSSETSIQYKLSGGGGGGGKNQCLNCGPTVGSAGGSTTFQFKNSSGSVIYTLTATGGRGGPYYNTANCGGYTVIFDEGTYPNPPWSGTISDGGNGGGGETNCQSGCSGEAGNKIDGIIVMPSGATSITITIGGGGSTGCASTTNPPPPRTGNAGAAWLLGQQS